MIAWGWSAEGRLLAGQADDGALLLWRTGTPSTVYGRSGSNSGGILQLWRADTGALVLTAEVDDEGAPALAWSPDGRTLVIGGSRLIRLWRP